MEERIFGIKACQKSIQKVYDIPFDWFSLKKKTRRESWAECPEEVLNAYAQIPELQTNKGRENFFKWTGLTLPEVSLEREFKDAVFDYAWALAVQAADGEEIEKVSFPWDKFKVISEVKPDTE